MAENGHKQSTEFYESGSIAQWKFVLSQYNTVLQLKADSKKKGGKELVKLDRWYHEELPDNIKKRPQKHLLHDEIVKIMKWKLLRGKFRPRLTDLVMTNTPLAVLQATKRGYKRMPKLSYALNALVVLKGVGPAMASAVLSAGTPDMAAFMSDEAMLSIPDITSVDYTTREYLNYSEKIQKCADRLNKLENNSAWTPNKVEQTLWTHYLAKQLYPHILDNMPDSDDQSVANENDNTNVSNGNSNLENPTQLSTDAQDETESSNDKIQDESSNDKIQDETESSNDKILDETESSNDKIQDETESSNDKIQDEDTKDSQDDENCDPAEAKEKDKSVTSEENSKLDDVEEPPSKKIKA